MRKRLAIALALLIAVSVANRASAQDNNAEGSVGKVKLGGLMFGDFYYNADAIDAKMKDVNGFQIRRIYITADYTISDNFSTRFRMESPMSGSGKISPYVKDAWLKWKNVYQNADLVVGMSPTPAFDVSEGAWHYRSLEKTIMDYNGIVHSRDLGIDLKGKFDSKGMVKYWVKIGDGTGNSPETDKYKEYYAMLEFTPSDNLLITVYGDMASMKQIADPNDPKTMLNNNQTVLAGFVNYHSGKKFSIGVEGFMRSWQNQAVDTTNNSAANLTSIGISAWAWAQITDGMNLVLRYDTFDPNTASATHDQNTKLNPANDASGLLIAALDFKADEHVHVMPGVEMLMKKDNISGKNVKDLVPRVTFFWSF